AQAASPSGRDVAPRQAARLLRLAVPRPLLVHGTGRDLLGRALGAPALLETLLDVLVLTLPLGVPCRLRHPTSPPFSCRVVQLLLPRVARRHRPASPLPHPGPLTRQRWLGPPPARPRAPGGGGRACPRWPRA